MITWPWEDLSIDDVAPPTESGLIRTVTLRPDQVAAITTEPTGPRSDIVLGTPTDGAVRVLLRPLLPDEILAIPAVAHQE